MKIENLFSVYYSTFIFTVYIDKEMFGKVQSNAYRRRTFLCIRVNKPNEGARCRLKELDTDDEAIVVTGKFVEILHVLSINRSDRTFLN